MSDVSRKSKTSSGASSKNSWSAVLTTAIRVLGISEFAVLRVKKIASWRHSGFAVHRKVRAQTRKEAEQVEK